MHWTKIQYFFSNRYISPTHLSLFDRGAQNYLLLNLSLCRKLSTFLYNHYQLDEVWKKFRDGVVMGNLPHNQWYRNLKKSVFPTVKHESLPKAVKRHVAYGNRASCA